jgi:tRNA threonylcarbamoyladenosine biosynthesis protein TsaE
LRFQCPGPDRTRQCARALGAAIAGRGLVVSLVGPLGAGKTVFVKGLAEGLGIEPTAVSSPSFTIVNEYTAGGKRRLSHVDLYRVESGRELEDAGFLDLLDPGAVVAVEWGDRLPEALPEDRLEIRLARLPSGPSPGAGEEMPPPSRQVATAGNADLRSVQARARGPESEHALKAWRALLISSSCVELEQEAPG